MQKREPFKAPDYQVTEPRADYIQRLAAAFEAWVNQDDATPQPEAKPYAAMAREWLAQIYDVASLASCADAIRSCTEKADDTAAIEALRAKIAALVEPVEPEQLWSATGIIGSVSQEGLARRGFTIIRTPDHD